MNLRNLLAGLTAAASLAAHAQPYPSRSIELSVDSAPGGGGDILTRVFAEALQAEVKQPTVVQNKPGGGGQIAATGVATAAPDGYTLLFATSNWISITPSLHRTVPFHPIQDFKPVAMVAGFPIVLAAHPGAGIKSFGELVSKAKAAPGTINYASTGIGSIQHLTMELLQKITGVKFEHVPYKAGAPALQDLLAGRVHVGLIGLPPTAPRIKAGQLVGLGVMSRTRSDLLPDLPTVAEQLGQSFEALAWFAVLAPKGTSDSVVAFLNAATNRVLSSEATKKRLRELGYDVMSGTPQDLAKYMKEDLDRWKVAIDLAGVKM